MLRGALYALAAIGLSACGGLQWPPPPNLTSNAPRPAATSAPAPAQSAPRSIVARDDETLYDIAKRTGATPRAIIEANKLQPPYRIASGQSLTVPAARSHTVVRGDTLYGISRQYGIDSHELARLNNLQPPYHIRVNQQLVLPGGDPRAPSGVEVVERQSAIPPVVSAPRPAVERVQVEDIRSAPIAAPVAAAPAPPAEPESKESAPMTLPASVIAAVQSGQPAKPEPAQPEIASVPASTPIERPAAESAADNIRTASLPRSNAKPRPGGRFIWPVEGKVLSEYGPKGDGLHNDGINIAAPKGAPVYAAANGTVAYAGNEIRGFGNLLLIQHSDGWMTAYAHNDKLLVKRGDKVTQGQQIGAVGQTGNVASPQLHFEIRRGKRAVDPLDQLGTLSARS